MALEKANSQTYQDQYGDRELRQVQARMNVCGESPQELIDRRIKLFLFNLWDESRALFTGPRRPHVPPLPAELPGGAEPTEKCLDYNRASAAMPSLVTRSRIAARLTN